MGCAQSKPRGLQSAHRARPGLGPRLDPWVLRSSRSDQNLAATRQPRPIFLRRPLDPPRSSMGAPPQLPCRSLILDAVQVPSALLAAPVSFRRVWNQKRGGTWSVYIWALVPPNDAFIALGDVATTSGRAPTPADFPQLRCVLRDNQAQPQTINLSRDHKTTSIVRRSHSLVDCVRSRDGAAATASTPRSGLARF
jgi:hypothetical protein